MKTASNTNRIAFLDNIRSLIIILVLIFHSGASYGSGVEFWPFHENNPSGIIDFFMFIGDVFFMAIMFFIAGYFVLSDFLKKGLCGFVKGKLKRLGLPWLIITIMVLPAIDYIHYVSNHIKQSLPTVDFVKYWLLSMKKIGEFHVGWMDMSTYYYMIDNFYQRYVWFISLLLLFSVIFGLLYKLKQYAPKQNEAAIDSTRNIFKILVITSVLMIVLFGFIRFKIYQEFMGNGWFSLGNIIQFQFGKIILYGCFFWLGIRAYSRKWFTGNKGFWKPWIWALICFCLFGLNMLALKNISSSEKPLLIAKVAFCALYPWWTLSFLGLFVSVAYKYWNRHTKFSMNLAANSYNMYLVHYIVPYTFPLLLSNLPIPVFIKFIIVSIVTLIFSYILGVLITKICPKILTK
jgi:hypothetical protein